MKNFKERVHKFLGILLLDFTHRRLIKLNKKDPLYHQFISQFKAKISIYTQNQEIARSLIFDGKGTIIYLKKKISEPDASLIFHSITDLYKFFRSFGDVYEGMLENRFELRGNSNLLFKYQFLTNYFNPKIQKIELDL